jgi:hypothetical protein
MKEFKSDQYKAVVQDDGLLTVTNGPRTLRETTFKDGVISVDLITQETAPDASYQRLLSRMNQMPVFSACWAGNRRWNVDIDCGMSRFNGVKPHGQLVKALKNCMFDQEQIDEIITLCKSTPKWDYCPRQW